MPFDFEIYVKCHDGDEGHCLSSSRNENRIRFDVIISSSPTGFDKTINVTDHWQANLVKKRRKANAPFLFSIQSSGLHKKHFVENHILLQCRSTSSLTCQVKILKFKVRDVSSLFISTDEATLPKRIFTDAKLLINTNGNIRIQSSIRCPNLNLKSCNGNVIVASEGILRTKSLEISATKTCVDGIISYFHDCSLQQHQETQNIPTATHVNGAEGEETEVDIAIETYLLVAIKGNLHIGTDGKIGCDRNSKSQGYNLVRYLTISVTGDIYNFGMITASLQIDLHGNNFLSGRDYKDDTVQRFYQRIEERLELNPILYSIFSNTEIPATTNSLQTAVEYQNPEQVADLLWRGVDPRAPINTKRRTIANLASNNLTKVFIPRDESTFSHAREQPDAIFSLIRAWEKRSGNVIAPKIKCTIEGNLDDCSQLKGFEIFFDVRGNVTIEEYSIWTSGIVSGRCDGKFKIAGNAKLTGFKNMFVGNTFLIEESGKVFLSIGGDLCVGKLFHNKNFIYACSKDEKCLFHVTTNIFQQSVDSKMGSKSMLQLTILEQTMQWEGTVEGNDVCFDIGADTQCNCTIFAEHICVIKILKGRQSEGKFNLLKKGSIKVINGKFIAVKDKAVKYSNEANITVAGILSSRGLYAESVNINLLHGSVTSLLPELRSDSQKVTCFIGVLCTESLSQIHLIAGSMSTQIDCKFDTWIHKGEISIQKIQSSNTIADIEVSKMFNKGKIENFDHLNLTIHRQMTNFRELSVAKKIFMTGSGTMINDCKSILRCRNGPIEIKQIGKLDIRPGSHFVGTVISIDTAHANKPETKESIVKWDFKNKGRLVSQKELIIRSWNICNKEGTLISRSSDVKVELASSFKTIIEGNVSAPNAITFTAQNAKILHCKCYGGGVSDCDQTLLKDCLYLPRRGINMVCPNGYIVIENEISGLSELSILSQKGCIIKRNICVSMLHFEDVFFPEENMGKNEDNNIIIQEQAQRMDDSPNACKSNKEVNNPEVADDYKILYQRTKTFDKAEDSVLHKENENVEDSNSNSHRDSLHPTIQEEERNSYSIKVLHDCVIEAHNIVLKSNDRSSLTTLKTYKSSKVICTRSMFADNTLNIKGLVDFKGECEVQAHALTFDKLSECEICWNDQTSPRLFLGGSKYVVIAGKLYQTERGNNLSSAVAVLSPNICLTGHIETEGLIFLKDAEEIRLIDGGILSCKGLSCEPDPLSESRTTTKLFVVANGFINVNGPLECTVETFSMEKNSVFSVSTGDHCHITAKLCTILSGKFDCCGGGYLSINCKDKLVFENMECNISMSNSILKSGNEMRTGERSLINVKDGNLIMTTANETDDEVTGTIIISGRIHASSSASSERDISVFEIECYDLQTVDSVIDGFQSFQIDVFSMFIDSHSSIENVDTVAIDAFILDVQGDIKLIENLSLKPRSLLVRGKIKEVNTIKIDAEFTAVNCGEIEAVRTGIVAPIYLNCPPVPECGLKKQLENLPKLGNAEQREIIVEGLLCIMVGSHIQGTRITLKSILRFDFATTTSTKLPGKNDLANWESIVKSSLSKLTENSHTADVKNIVEEALKIPNVVCNLGVGSHLCNDIVRMSQTIQKEGLNAFRVNDLVGCLNKAHTEYSKICPLQLDLKLIPKLRKVKDIAKTIAKKLIQKCFGHSSFSSTFEFRYKKSDTIIEEGVDTTSFVFIGQETDIKTGGKFTATSLVLGGEEGIWKNEGLLQTCGDIIVSARFIGQGGSKRKLMRSLYGCIQLTADKVDVRDLQSKQLKVNATKQVKIESANIAENTEICGEDIAVKEVKTENIKLQGTNNVNAESLETTQNTTISGTDVKIKDLKSETMDITGSCSVDADAINVKEDTFVKGQTITAKDIKAGYLCASGTKTVQIDSAKIRQNALIESSGNAQIKNLTAKDIFIQAGNNVDVGNAKAQDNIQVHSSKGNINVNANIKGKTAQFEAREGNISLTGTTGKANHEFERLIMRTKQFKDIEKMLNKTGGYRDLKIRDELDLAVDEQNVLLANIRKMEFGLTLAATSINIDGDIMSDKSLNLKASAGDINVRDKAKIKAKENIKFAAESKINLNEDSSVKAGRDVHIESQKNAVSIKAATVEGGGAVVIKAKGDVNVLAKGGNGAAKKSMIKAGTGGDSTTSVTLISDKDINIHASVVKGEGENKFFAKRNIDITAHTYETVKKRKKKTWCGLKTKRTMTTTTHVDKSEITGESNTFVAGGNFRSIGSNLTSHLGNTVHAKGSVSMKDIVAKTVTRKSTSVFGGLLYHKTEKKSSEKSYGTLVEDTSSLANTSIISDTSNIEWEGSSMTSPGNVSEVAKMGRVEHKNRILTNTRTVTESGFYIRKSSSDSNKESNSNNAGGIFGYHYHNSSEVNQSTSDASLNVGNYSVHAEEFNALNSFGVNITENCTLDVRKFKFEGAKLNSTETTFDVGLEIEKTKLAFSADYSQACATKHQAQTVYVGGKLLLNDVDKGVFDDSQTDVGEIEGHAGNLNLISRADTDSRMHCGMQVGIDLVTRTPEFGISAGSGNSKLVNLQTNLNVRSSSHGFSVGSLTLKGATVTFDGDVHNFAKEIISEDVQEMENNLNVEFSMSKPTSVVKGSKTLSFSYDHMRGRTKSCMTSLHGTVHDSIRKKTNTDITKCRVVDEKFGISIKHEFKGGFSDNIASLGKEIVKSVGKEVAATCIVRISTELGLPADIAKVIINIAEGENPMKNAFEFMMFKAGEGFLPKELIDALQILFIDGNPIGVVKWICKKIGVPSDLIDAILDILPDRKTSEATIIKLVKSVSKYFGLSDEFISVIDVLKRCDKGNKGNIKATTFKIIKSPEGLKAIQKLANVLGVPCEITKFIISVIKQSDPIKTGMAIIQLIAPVIGLSSNATDALMAIMLHGDMKKFVALFVGEICADRKIIAIVTQALTACKDVKTTVKTIVRQFAEHHGVSKIVVDGVECMVQGKKPKDSFHNLVIQILKDMSHMFNGEKAKHATRVLNQKVIPILEKFMTITKQFAVLLKKLIDRKFDVAAAIPFVKLLLETAGIHNDMIEGLQCMILEKDPIPLACLFSKTKHSNSQILIALAQDLKIGAGIPQMCQTLFNAFVQRTKFPVEIISDVKLILQGLEPQSGLKTLSEIIAPSEEGVSKEAFAMKCEELKISVDHIDVLLQISLYYHNQEITSDLFKCLAGKVGVPVRLAEGIDTWLNQGSSLTLAGWIEEEIGLQQNLSVKCMEIFRMEHVNSNTIIDFILTICGTLGMSESVVECLRLTFKITDERLEENNMLQLFVKIMIDFISPQIQEFAKHTGIPSRLIEDLIAIANSKDPSLTILKLLATKIGISDDLFDAMVNVIYHKDLDSIVKWISQWKQIDPVLVKSILQAIQNSTSFSALMKKLPVCLMNYIGLSDDSVQLVQTLLSGKIPKCGLLQLLKSILLEVANSKFGERLIDASLNVAADHGISLDVVASIKKLVFSDNPLESVMKIVELITVQIGFPKDIFTGIAQLVLQSDPSDLFMCLSSRYTNMHLSQTKTVIETILISKNMTDAIQKSSTLILEEIGFTERSISGIMALYTDEISNSDILATLSHIVQDIQNIINNTSKSIQGVNLFADLIKILTDKDMIDHPERISLQLAIFFLKVAGVNESFLSGIESLLSTGNCGDLVALVCRLCGVEKDIVLSVVRSLINSPTPIDRVRIIIVSLCKYSEFSEDTTKTIECIIHGNKLHINKVKSSDKHVCDLLSTNDVPPDVVEILDGILIDEELKLDNLIRLLISIADKSGLPSELVESIKTFVSRQDLGPIATLISKYTDLQPDLIKVLLDLVFKGGEECILTLTKVVARSIGIEEEVILDIGKILREKLSEDQLKIHLKGLAKNVTVGLLTRETNRGHLPEQILRPVIDILNGNDIKDNIVCIVTFFFEEIGISKDLIDGLISFAQERKTTKLGKWISRKFEVDPSLTDALLKPFTDNDSLLDGLRQMPKYIVQYVGMSDHVITVIEEILNGQSTECDITAVIKETTEGVLKSKLTSNIVSHLSDKFPGIEHLPKLIDVIIDIMKAETWLQQVIILVRFFAPKLEIPPVILEGFIDLIQKRDPSKLISWLAKETGINEKLLMILAEALMKHESPMNIVRILAKIAGLPEATVPLIEEIIKNKGKISNTHKKGCSGKIRGISNEEKNTNCRTHIVKAVA